MVFLRASFEGAIARSRVGIASRIALAGLNFVSDGAYRGSNVEQETYRMD